jgi:predicted acyltransferase
VTDRIASMDQFRGYAVAGMFVVNFLAGLAAVHPILQHNNYYFSYADSILPAFLFAAGFSHRLTMLRRLAKGDRAGAYRHAVVRSLALILVSVAFFGIESPGNTWAELTGGRGREFVAEVLKAKMWNVLAIIGAVQLLVLPVVAAGAGVRVLTAAAFLAGHVALSQSFNYEFVYGRPNWIDAYWGAAKTRAWDGGFFGLLTWVVPLLGGTIAYDIFVAPGRRGTVGKLAAIGAVLMALGYGLSCLSTLYPGEPEAAPVFPPLDRLESYSPESLLARPPFVPPPDPSVRAPSYWLMDKRVVTVPFALFGTGMAFAVYGLFVLVCDRGGRQLGLFRILGQNPLVAYLLHYPVLKSVRALVPKDAPLWWCLVGLAVFFGITTAFVRYLDRHKLYLRI